MLSKVVVVSLCLALLVFAGSGCKSKKGQELDTGFDTSSTGMEQTTGEGLPDLDLERLLFDPTSDSGLKPIYFDFDSSSLRPDALIALRDNAEKIKQVPGVYVQIAGHCDERGTQEYNLALGERRALAVRNHLIQLGVSGDRLVTISYGKEFPAVLGSNEAAWAKNRRAEFNRAR
jgi:peptidoglycan-associated lipoprotein